MNQMASGSNLRVDAALNAIGSIPKGESRWLAVAFYAEQIRETGAWREKYQSPTEWLEAAAEAAGYTANTLRRFITVRNFLCEKTQQKEADAADPFCGGGSLNQFGPLEYIKKLHDVAPTVALDALDKHTKSPLTVREIKGLYDKYRDQGFSIVFANPPYRRTSDLAAPNASKLGLRRTNKSKSELLSRVKSQIKDFTGSDDAIVVPNKFDFEFCSPDVVAIGMQNFAIKFVDGFELRAFKSGLTPAVLKSTLAEVTLSSTFFRRYWVVVDGLDAAATRIVEGLDKLLAGSVGVAIIKGSNLLPVRRPSGSPSPDRHDISRSRVLNQGIPR